MAANTITISVEVNHDTQWMMSTDLHHVFTVRELRAVCRENQVPVDGATFRRNGEVLNDASEIHDGDQLTTHFGKGEDGRC